MYKRAYFLCCATYHLTVALYYAMQVEWKNVEKILVWQNNTNAVVDKKILNNNFDKVINVRGRDLASYPFLEQQRYKIVNAGWLFPLSTIGKMIHERPNNNAVFLFNDTTRLTDKVVYEFGKRRDNIIVLVEEGTGTYHHNIIVKDFKTNLGNFVCGQKTEPYIGANPFISTVIARKIDELPSYQIEGRKVIKQNNLFFDNEWTKKILKNIKPIIDRYISNEDKKIALWIGEPLSPSLINETSESKSLERIFSKIAEEYTILVKMHPRENSQKYEVFSSKYGVRVIKVDSLSWFPVEIFANVLNPSIVLTPMSSALMGIVSSIKAIFCYKLFNIETSNHMINDLTTKRSNTYLIDTIEELETALKTDNSVIGKVEGDGINSDKDIAFIQKEIVGC